MSNQYQCCADIDYNITTVNSDGSTTVTTESMVKCPYEDKCVAQEDLNQCFTPAIRNCTEVYGAEFSYQCLNDGKCKRNVTECPSPRVCPVNYTQCPDYTCLIGVGRYSECS